MTASLLARLKGLKQKVKTKLKTKLSRSKNKTTSFVPAGTDAARTVDLVYPVDTNTKPDTQVNALNLTLDTPTRSFVAWPRSRPQPFEVQSRPRVYIPDLKVDTNTNVNAPEDDYYYLPLSPNATGTRLTDTEDNMPLSMLNTKTKQNEFADYVPAMAAYAAGTVADYDSDSEDEDADGPVNIITAFKPDVPTARLTTITTTTAVMTTIALVPTTIPMTATTPNANAQTSTSNGRAPQRATTYTSTPVSQQTFHRVSIQETVPLRRSLLSPKRLGITLRLKKGNKANTIDTNTAPQYQSQLDPEPESEPQLPDDPRLAPALRLQFPRLLIRPMGSDLDNRTYHEVPLQDFQKGGIPLVEVRETTAKTLSAPCNVLKELNPTDPGVIGRDSAGGLRLVNPWVSHKIGDIIMNSNVNPYDAWAFGGKVVWINPAGDVVYSCPFSPIYNQPTLAPSPWISSGGGDAKQVAADDTMGAVLLNTGSVYYFYHNRNPFVAVLPPNPFLQHDPHADYVASAMKRIAMARGHLWTLHGDGHIWRYTPETNKWNYVQHDSHAIDIQVVNNLFVITRLQANPPYNTESYTYRWDDAKTPYGNTEIVLMSPYADLRNTVQRYTGMHKTLFLRTNGTVVRRRIAPDNSGAHQDVMTFPRDRHGFPARIIAVSEHAAIAEGDLLPPAAILDDM